MADLNQISAQEMGRRLRIARESAGIRQADAAEVIGLSRPTLVSIEKGARRLRIRELESLAHRYGTTANALLRHEAVHADLVPQFRKLPDAKNRHTLEAAGLLSALVQAEAELENVLGIARRMNYPDERGIGAGDVRELAERHARELRDWLGVDAGPIADIFGLMETGLGIRLYQRYFSPKSKVAGLFAWSRDVGACVLLNARYPLEQRIQSAAHELGHFCGTRRAPEVLGGAARPASRAERYANAFARAFLAPRRSFADRFRTLTDGSSALTLHHVVRLAHEHHLSRESCVRRLMELDLVKTGVWDWYTAHGGAADAPARRILGAARRPDPAQEEAKRPVPYRIGMMAHTAWTRALLSEGQLSVLLRLGRIEFRTLMDEIETQEIQADAAGALPIR